MEPSSEQLRRRRRQGRYVDYLAGLYHLWRRRLNGYAAYRRQYFAVAPPAHASQPQPIRHRVTSINAPETAHVLQTVQPDAVVVISTSIIAPRILALSNGPVLNIHGGCLPYYKGNHCYFFALYHGAFDRIGSTIHFVSQGVDTGDIVEVIRPELREDDTPETLYCRGQMLAIHRLAEWLDHFARGGCIPRTPQEPVGRAYRTRSRSPIDDLWFTLRRKTGRLKIPNRPAAPLLPLPSRAGAECPGP